MRVGLLMRDIEYRDAMTEMIAASGRDIFVEIAGSSGIHREAVILTDISPHEIDDASLDKLRNRTLFLSAIPLSSESRNIEEGCHFAFKYSSFTTIMAELSLLYAEWTGDMGSISSSGRCIAVIGESDQLSAERCRSLAGQIIYRHGGTVLIIPLGYINDHRCIAGEDDRGWFKRLMYILDEGRDYPADSFTYTDNYGISYLKLPGGINPLSGLGNEYLVKLVSSMGSRFDTLILDVGTCFRQENLSLISGADNVLFFGSGRRIENLAAITGDSIAARAKRIDAANVSSEALGIDDFVRSIYGEIMT